MAVDELRRILKVFGVAVTDFAEESARLRERAGRLATASPQEVAAVLRDLCELLSDVEGKSVEAARAIHSIKGELLSAVAQAARARAEGGK